MKYGDLLMSDKNKTVGVTYNKHRGTYSSRIYQDGRTYGMGTYKNRDDAQKARDKGIAVLEFKRHRNVSDSFH